MVVLPGKLDIISSDGTRREIDITKDLMTFGSHPKCDVILKRQDISSEHAQIVRNNEGYFLVNMDGRNSVTLNSVPIRNRIKQKLRQDDVITLGSAIKIIFKFGSVAPSSPNSWINSTYLLIGLSVLAFISIMVILFLPKRSPSNSNSANKVAINAAEKKPSENSSAVNSPPENSVAANSNQTNVNLSNAVNEPPKSNSNSRTVKAGISRYEAKMTGIISSISGKDNFIFRENFIAMVVNRIEEYKTKYPDFYDYIKSKSQDINREFNNNGINPRMAYILSFSRNSTKNPKNLFNISEAPSRIDKTSDNQTKILATYIKDLLGAFEQDYLKTIANIGISVSEAGRINAERNKVPSNLTNSKIIDEKRFSENELNSLAAFFAAGIVASSPKEFGLTVPEIGTLE